MSDGTRIPSTSAEQRRAWRRLVGALRPRANLSQVIVGGLCLLLGVSIAVQVHSRGEDALAGASQQELLRLLDESGRHESELEAENAELDRTLETLRSSRDDDVAAQNAAEQRLRDLEIVAGTIPAHGRGLEITIRPRHDVPVRPSTLLGLLQELRNAGAEVVQIGDVRVIASTSITASDSGGLLVDGTAVPEELTVRAIGDPAVMEPALRIPGGAADAIGADGSDITITAQKDVKIDAVRELARPRHAEVVK